MNDEEWEKSGADFIKWENSLEGIHYNLFTIGEAWEEDEYHKILIAKTLQKLPKDVRDKVLDEVIFVICSGYGTVHELFFRIDSKVKEIRRPLIILNFALMRKEGKNESDMMDTVAHETAHFMLGHTHLHNDPEGERKADDLAESWGFKRAYKDYTHFERQVKKKK